MSNDELDEMKAKKKELEAELNRLQNELDNTLDEVRSDVSHKLKPTEIIKNYPIPAVGLSLLIGFLAGHKPRKSSGSVTSADGNQGDEGFTSLLLTELKRLATRKAVTAATDYLDDLLEAKKGDTLFSSDDIAENNE